jgi:signal transduction histidine kinase
VQIRDDGVGADPGRQRTGLGLVGMRERVEALGGSLAVSSASGTGFTLIAHIPTASSR